MSTVIYKDYKCESEIDRNVNEFMRSIRVEEGQTLDSVMRSTLHDIISPYVYTKRGLHEVYGVPEVPEPVVLHPLDHLPGHNILTISAEDLERLNEYTVLLNRCVDNLIVGLERRGEKIKGYIRTLEKIAIFSRGSNVTEKVSGAGNTHCVTDISTLKQINDLALRKI